MKIALFTYDWYHKKTQDFLFTMVKTVPKVYSLLYAHHPEVIGVALQKIVSGESINPLKAT